MEIEELVRRLEARVENPEKGLPEAVFLLLTRLTPMVNVDLLIDDDSGRTLLTWRSDSQHGSGWHIPGGIIRLRETAEERIRLVALNELGVTVRAEAAPLAVHTAIRPEYHNRSHFISFLYRCRLTAALPEQRRAERPEPGEYRWFRTAPDDLLSAHIPYRGYIGNKG